MRPIHLVHKMEEESSNIVTWSGS